ncbi:MAG: transposase [Verrucomicrobiota bacterium]|nr:transposase [Verrucomicrobiota bacterium]
MSGGRAFRYDLPVFKGRPPRLDRIFQAYDSPLFFVTFCTRRPRKIEPLEVAHAAFLAYCGRARDAFNVAVGRYVIMPDHAHLFVQGDLRFRLEPWVGGLKRAISVSLGRGPTKPLWQPGFFDHLLRNEESYGQKWDYVRENPARAGLVERPEDWPFQGEIVTIDRV